MNLTNSKIFLRICIFFIFGAAAASFLPAQWLRYDLWFFGAMVGLGVLIILQKQCSGGSPALARCNRRPATTLFLFILFFIVGIWRYAVSLPPDTPDKIWHYNGQNAEFIGAVNREPDVRIYNTKLTLRVEFLKTPQRDALVPVNGNILITTKSFPEYNYGDWLSVRCKLEEPEMVNEFAYDRYLARHGVYSLCYYPKITPLPNPPLGKEREFYGFILDLKNKLKDAVNYGLPEPEASLLQAIILGNKRGLTPEILDNFSKTGISHIVAISGMHIAIISVIIINMLLAIGLPRRWAFLFSSLSLLIYIILIGLPASAMRAGLMAFLAMLAIYLGRMSKITNSLFLSAVILLLLNPRLLRDDVGFQLSFLAVLSIVYVKPIIDGWIKKMKFVEARCNASLPKGIIDIITVTLAAQVLTLPVIALNFHQVSVVSPLVNVLVLFLLPFIMVSGMLAAVIGMFFTELAWLFFTPAYFMLKYLLWIVDVSVKLPLAYLEIDYVWVGWVILFYAAAGWWIYRYNKNKLT